VIETGINIGSVGGKFFPIRMDDHGRVVVEMSDDGSLLVDWQLVEKWAKQLFPLRFGTPPEEAGTMIMLHALLAMRDGRIRETSA
jgi:hypothetical protein